MDTVNTTLNQVNSTFHSSPVLNWLNNSIVSNLIILIFVLYANKLAPTLPDSISQWFHNYVVKIIAVFLFIYAISNNNFGVAWFTLLSLVIIFLVLLMIEYIISAETNNYSG